MKFLIGCAAILALANNVQASLDNNPAPPDSPSPSPEAPCPDDEPDCNVFHRPAPADSPSPTTSGPQIDGCTDESACNYDSTATSDDGSCTYPDTGKDCDGNCADGLVEDCTGVCGGKASCCPATCAVGKGTAMSCDDVAMSVGSSTTETCNTLEASYGCDCGGCSCGIIIDADGYEQMDGYVASTLTCDKSEKLSTNPQPCTAANTCTATECKQHCTDASDCNYAAWNTQGGCILYSSCKVQRTVASTTTTYHRVANNQGTVDTGECQCTWWTCVNDNGAGVCP